MQVWQHERSRFRGTICGIILLAIQLAVFAACNQPASHPSAKIAYDNPTAPTPTPKDPQEAIRSLVRSLKSSDNQRRVIAERELLKLAHESSEDRKNVISEILMSLQAESELDGSHSVLSPVTFEYWSSTTSLVAQLKATEGIDAMITCIQCSNGYSGTMGEPPASYALVQMGTIAIPKLSQALSQEGDGYKRIRIVLCLSRIGGPQAKEGLKKALSSEKDESVRRYIRRALRLST